MSSAARRPRRLLAVAAIAFVGLGAVAAFAAPARAASGPARSAVPPAAFVGASAMPGPDATPTPSSGDVTGDLRSSGQGAGAAGNPGGAVWAFLIVVAIGLLSAGGTVAYVRATGGATSGSGSGNAEGSGRAERSSDAGAGEPESATRRRRVRARTVASDSTRISPSGDSRDNGPQPR